MCHSRRPPSTVSITECFRVVYRYTSIRERVFCCRIKRQLEAIETAKGNLKPNSLFRVTSATFARESSIRCSSAGALRSTEPRGRGSLTSRQFVIIGVVVQRLFHTVNVLNGTTTPRFANGTRGALATHDPPTSVLANVRGARGACRRASEEACPRFV